MKKGFDIEKIMQEKFKDFSAKPDANLFENIQQQANLSNAASSASKAATIGAKAKIAIIAAATVISAVTIGYFVSTDEKAESNDTQNPKQTENTSQKKNNQSKEPQDDKQPDQQKLAEVNRSPKEQEVEATADNTENPFPNENQENASAPASTTGETMSKMPTNKSNTINSALNGAVNNSIDTNYTRPHQGNNNNEVKLEAAPDATISEDMVPLEVNFTANSNAASFYWDFGDQSTSTLPNPVHQYDAPGRYDVTLEVEKGNQIITKTLSVTVKKGSAIDSLPNFITPNGDGSNDYLQINSKRIKTLFIEIYNSSGEKVFESRKDPDFKWDGTDFSGEPVREKCRYNYNAVGEDGSTYSGQEALYIIRN